jgi:hypothetical protein
MRAFLAVLLSCLATSACNPRRHRTTYTPPSVSVPSTLISGNFITTSGSYTHGDSNVTHELELNHAGRAVHWSHSVSLHSPSTSGGGSSSSSMSLSSPTDPWFVFVEVPERLWFFNGKDTLFCRLTEGASTRAVEAISGGVLDPASEPIPAEVVSRLPAELQKIVPAAESKRRPSI